MASSSSSSPPPSTNANIPQGKHDVFLSFRGEDTRHNFTSHLNSALSRLHIKTFIDQEMQRGDEISPLLISAIERAKISIIIFSKNYAFSKWCLDEVDKIIECKINNGQIIMPIFFHVDPSHVRNQTGSYAEAFAMHEKNFSNDMKRVLRWKASLEAAGKHSGWHCDLSSTESELVEKIAQDVSQKLDSISGSGIDSRLRMHRQTTQVKYEKYLATSSSSDLDDLVKALQQLLQLKVEKVLKTNDEDDWNDVFNTGNLILRFKYEKWIRDENSVDYRDWKASKSHLDQLVQEKENRSQGLSNWI